MLDNDMQQEFERQAFNLRLSPGLQPCPPHLLSLPPPPQSPASPPTLEGGKLHDTKHSAHNKFPVIHDQ